MESVKNYLYNNRKLFYLVLFILQVILFYCYGYGDLSITTEHGISFWECLFSGKIRDYYNINISTELHAGVYNGNYFAAYDFMSYIIFGIWNFPLWVARHFFGVQYPLDYLLGNLWAESIVLAFYCGCIYFANKILKLVNINECKKYIAIMSTSAFVSLYIIVFGQYDVICIFFILWGIYSLLTGNRIMFLVAFSIAVPIKMLALFMFVPIVLLCEKNILKVMASGVIVMIPMLFFRVLIPFSDISNTSVFMELLFANTIKVGYTECSVFLLVYILFLIYCYIKSAAVEIEKRVEQFVYICFVSFAIFIVFVGALPYWAMYFVPFIYMLYIINTENRYINLILETCMSASLVISQILHFYYMTTGTIVQNMLLGNIFDLSGINGIGWHNIGLKYMSNDAWNELLNVVHIGAWAVFVATVLVFIYINNPFNKKKIIIGNIDSDSNRCIVLLARCAITIVVLITPFCGLFF